MSVESCTAFLRVARQDARVRQQMKAMTGIAEVIRLGRVHGYRFDDRDLMMASSSAADTGEHEPEPEPPPADASTAFYHYEYDMERIPGFAAVIAELPKLKIKPDTVDLARFDERFRLEDLRSTSMVPGGTDHRRWRAGLDAQIDRETRRDFHLINLDEHVGHAAYDDYFAAKTRLIDALENVFGGEVRFSGSMWYPPSGYRLWHTNETQPGWRMYLIDFDEDFDDPQHTSFFRYLHPETGELVTLRERPRLVRFFKIEQDPERLFWHCIVNPTRRHRWSFGFNVPGTWLDDLAGLS